jgi:hypothetical protein
MSAYRAVSTFQDRVLELTAMTAGPSEGVRVLNFHGEAGIGKSRLLKEGAARLSANPQALVLRTDLTALSSQREGRSLTLLRQLTEGSAQLAIAADDSDTIAAQLVDRLNMVASDRRVTVLVDTTEAIQDDTGFWQWFERSLLSPLISEGNVLVVLAGRLPAPIRLVEVRRYLKVWPLEPLPIKDDARQLVREVLTATPGSFALDDPRETKRGTKLADEFADLVLSFSHGHPRLSEEIAQFLAVPGNQEPADSLRRRVAEEVVRPFIDRELFPFRPDMARWRPLMEWASVLDWFDATVFYHFDLALSGSQQPEIEWQYDFVKAMAQLRAPYAVVKWEGAGYTLVGTIKSIVASYMQAARHVEYIRSLRAAVEVFDQIVEDLFADNPQAGEPYGKAARSYEQRLEREVQHGQAQ